MIKRIFTVLFSIVTCVVTAQEIDLSNWKITIPASRPDNASKPMEVEPPEIQDFEKNAILKPFFYKDQEDGALVFYARPAQSTANSKYSRTEFREQLEPGNNKVNWTFEQGGTLRGTLSVPDVSKDEKGNAHKVIVMQIHGRLTNEQKKLISKKDNDAPPILKIYWHKGRVRVKTKELKEPDDVFPEILHKNAWKDDEGRKFREHVGYEKFTLEVVASKGKLSVTLNDNETFVYDGPDMEKWNVFENYFKAGNYLQTRDAGAYAYVKYYDLEVQH